MNHTDMDRMQLSELGAMRNLSFSSQEVLGSKIIGLDGLKRILVIAEKNHVMKRFRIIELNKVDVISIKKFYRSIRAGELKKKPVEEFIESVNLQFEFRNGNEMVLLPFYESKINDITDLSVLEQKAVNWQIILSKMIGRPARKINDQSVYNRPV